MMTVAEGELLKQAAQKGRSASFCVPPPPSVAPTQHREKTQNSEEEVGTAAEGAAAHPNQDLGFPEKQIMSSETKNLTHHDSLQASDTLGPSAENKLKVDDSSQSARRTQSCRVPSSKNSSRPHVRRRVRDSTGSGPGSNANLGPSEGTERNTEDDSYNPFLKKVPSCGRLLALNPEDCCMFMPDDSGGLEDSPVLLRRSASARRPAATRHGLSDSPVDHSPTPPRSGRHPRNRSAGSARRASNRRTGGGGALLEVRDPNQSSNHQSGTQGETLDTDQYLLRNFSTTTKGSIINRGDSFRRRRSRSNSIQPPPNDLLLPPQPSSPTTSSSSQQQDTTTSCGSSTLTGTAATAAVVQTPDDTDEETGCAHAGCYRVPIIGAAGVGKTALIHQFRTSECINAYDCPGPSTDDEKESTVSIVLNGYESDIVFVNVSNAEDMAEELTKDISGWVVVYSITDKSSFQRASEELLKLQNMSLLKGKAIVLVANKCELVRSRAVNVDDGRDLACSYGAKFMEISVGMNHKCDDLLVGIMHQLRLKADTDGRPEDKSDRNPFKRNRSLMRASMKAKRLLHRVMGKTDSKYKSCEDFNN